MKKNTVAVILEYCGGSRTDALYEAFRSANPEIIIHVLDNASPNNHSRYVTMRNRVNSYIGGGLIDSIRLAERENAQFLFFISNDIEIIRMPSIRHFEAEANEDKEVVLVGTSITSETGQARPYPWMVNQGGTEERLAPHYDPLCCLFRLDFIRSFGGFPPSQGGWGYDLQFACYAKFRNKKIIVSDTGIVHHRGDASDSSETIEKQMRKRAEMQNIYDRLYGDHRLLHAWRASGCIPELLYQFGPPGFLRRVRRLNDVQRKIAIEKMFESIYGTQLESRSECLN